MLKFKRDRNIKNKGELARLERQFENGIQEIEILEKSKTNAASIAAFTIGIAGAAFMAGSVFAYLAGMTPLMVILAIPGFAGWLLHTGFRKIWLVKDFEEAARYSSPELTLDQQSDHRAVLTHKELINKIELNKAFQDELKYKVRALKWSRLTAFKFNANYLPAHYTVRLSPLRFVDMPKFRTIISFGDRIVLQNSSYINAVSNVRIWVYEKIIELLEVRLRCYNDLAKEFSETAASETKEIVFPSWYSESRANALIFRGEL